MALTHNLGYPRIGDKRQLKFACEAYWRGETSAEQLHTQALEVYQHNIIAQTQSGLDYVPCGDFALYDHVLNTSFLLGHVPARFRDPSNRDTPELDQYFRVARGRSVQGSPVTAGEMTKWFDTNYHYIVPELAADTRFELNAEPWLKQIDNARQSQGRNGQQVKPVLLGPLSYLWLSKVKNGDDDKLTYLEPLIPLYQQLLEQVSQQGLPWVQIDEPILGLDLPREWLQRFESTYHRLQVKGVNVLLTTYFSELADNLYATMNLPVAGIHLDAVRGRADVDKALDTLPVHKVLSLGVIDGRNIWKSDLNALLDWLEPIHKRLGDRLWLAPSCSLLHVPVDLSLEAKLDTTIKQWLAFARQKLTELNLLKTALNEGQQAIPKNLEDNAAAIRARQQSERVTNPAVQKRSDAVTEADFRRSQPYRERRNAQQAKLKLPPFPTTTIGSFPQTTAIRKLRKRHKQGELSTAHYHSQLREHIAHSVQEQQDLGLDVLVHGEAERNDMVEYFGEQLEGYAFTQFGWVQSYGSRCVKPPIIFGDVSRPEPMTVAWSRYAQSLTDKPMKGMLTGPITLLQWAFVRDDQPRATTARQIALALRDEILDLEAAGIGVIQVDEPALREGLPLRQSQWASYLEWAVKAFRLATAGVAPQTQIHTHMCYAEFNDIIQAIADLDADVITIETSRSDMELLEAFREFQYPNEIGPGVYDIHSPNTPDQAHMVNLLNKAQQRIPAEQLWVNPDCGLKTRQWAEVTPALKAMVAAAQSLRDKA